VHLVGFIVRIRAF